MSIIVLKSGEKVNDLVALAKGLIDPSDIANGGDLSPQQSSKIFAMVEKDPFLSKIHTEYMMRLEKDVDNLDVSRRNGVRVAQGVEPKDSDLPDANEHGCVLRALSVQTFPIIKLDTLRSYADNPKILKIIEGMFDTQLTNDIVDLGFNGIADDGAGSTRDQKFLRLNKGWIQIAKDHDKVEKVAIDPATDTWRAALGSILNKADVRFKSNSVFLMNEADADAYADELGQHVTGKALDAEGPLRKYKGKTIVAHPLMPEGHVLFTPLKNLVFGLHKDMRRSKSYHDTKRVLQFVFDQAFDYEIGVKQAAILGKPE